MLNHEAGPWDFALVRLLSIGQSPCPVNSEFLIHRTVSTFNFQTVGPPFSVILLTLALKIDGRLSRGNKSVPEDFFETSFAKISEY